MKTSIDSLKDTKLFKHLSSVNKELSEKCITFVRHVSPLLNSIVIHFPFYTSHNEFHSLKIIERMESILINNCFVKNKKSCLSETETFLLICSAYGHDLGMTVLPGEKGLILETLGIEDKPGWETDPALQEYLRNTHSIRGGDYIFKEIDNVGIPIHLHQHLNLLMKSHNLSKIELTTQLGNRFSSDFEEINLMQLASILCIADLIEFSEIRVFDGVIQVLDLEVNSRPTPAVKKSLLENLKHVCIGSNVAVGNKDGKIIISGTFKDPDVISAAYSTVDYIEKWIRIYGDIDYNSEQKRLKIRTDSVSVTFDMPGKQFERLGIRMNKQNVINLISSNSIWLNKPETVVRELLQNSVEACRYRNFNSPEDSYTPTISLEIDLDKRRLIVSDNGCGMSRSIILNNFLTVGNSRSKEPGYNSKNYSSLARFGIGFWSVFTIADEVTIETREFQPGFGQSIYGLTFDVSINQLKDYVLFRSKEMLPGTRVTLHLKDKVNISDLNSKIYGPYGVMLSSAIPIKIKYQNKLLEIPLSPVLPTLASLFGPKINSIIKENVKLYTYEFKSNSTTIDSYLLFRKENGEVTFKNSNGDSLKIFPGNYEVFCICGFTISHSLKFPIYEILPDNMGYISNSLDPTGHEFNINRSVILDSPAMAESMNQTVQELLEMYRNFLKEHLSYTPSEICRLYEEGHTIKRVGQFDYQNNFAKLSTIASDLLCFKLYKISNIDNFASSKVEFLNLATLIERDYITITVFQNISAHSASNHIRFNNQFKYDLCKEIFRDSIDNVFLLVRKDSDPLFLNDPNSYIIAQEFNYLNTPCNSIYLFCTNTRTLLPVQENKQIIGFIQGFNWTGFITEKRIINSKFAFIDQNCFLQEGSQLALDIRSLYSEGRFSEVGELVQKIELSIYGHIDPDIRKYL